MANKDQKTDIQNDEQDRRAFYRIEDTAILEVKIVNQEDMINSKAEGHFSDSSAFRLMRQLRAVDHENAGLLRSIGEKNQNLSVYLQAINKKIDLIAQAAAFELGVEKTQLQTVDLSQGGIGFNYADKLEANQYYAIKIWFQQSFMGIATYIKAVACHPVIDGGYHISSSFHKLQEADAQIVNKHIMQIQAKQLRERRGIS